MRAACLLPGIAALLVMGCGHKPTSQQGAEPIAAQQSSGPRTARLPVRATSQPGTGTEQSKPQLKLTTQKSAETTEPTKAQEKPPAPKVTTEPEAAGAFTPSGVARTLLAPEVRGHLKEIALSYRLALDQSGPIKDVAAFKNSFKNTHRKIYEYLEENTYVVVPNLRNPGSSKVIAYERVADRAGQHLVAMGDGSVQQMSTQDLKKALKGQ